MDDGTRYYVSYFYDNNVEYEIKIEFLYNKEKIYVNLIPTNFFKTCIEYFIHRISTAKKNEANKDLIIDIDTLENIF